MIMTMPTTMAWMKATPTTPRATARMVAVDSVGELLAASAADDAPEDGLRGFGTRLAEGHDDARR